MKFHEIKEGVFVFHCPGCGDVHTIHTARSGAQHPRCWDFNGDIDNPTISPSLLVRSGHYINEWKIERCYCEHKKEYPEETGLPTCYRCHSFIKNGQIQFLSDCSHELKGQTVEIPDFETLHPNWTD